LTCVVERDVFNSLTHSPPFHFKSGDMVALIQDPSVSESKFISAARLALERFRDIDTG
jgi:hypothetical protein